MRPAHFLAFLAVYVLLYAGFGAASPFFPRMLEQRGLSSVEIGTLLATATAVRLISSPLAALIADRRDAHRIVLALCAIGAACAALAITFAEGRATLWLAALVQAFALAPLTVVSDALAVVRRGTAVSERQPYPWIRGSGSLAFIIGSVVSGLLVASTTLAATLNAQAILLAMMAACVPLLPPMPTPVRKEHGPPQPGAVRQLLLNREFLRVVLVAALVLGSHALHDGFALIRWSAAGIGPQAAGVLWSTAVAGEVVVFFVAGPWLLARYGPYGCMVLATLAAIARWTVSAVTADVYVTAVLQPMHGLTFALLHLSAMRIIAEVVPVSLAATAQAIYGTIGIGLASAALTLLSGFLYGRFGAGAFLAMAILCGLALPLLVRPGWALAPQRSQGPPL